MITNEINQRLQHKKILLMSHLVLGYPDIETNLQTIDLMAEHGVDLIELQIPFSEPTADGPTIAHANHEALAGGFTIESAFAVAAQAKQKHPHLQLIFMTYFNIPYAYGLEAFLQRSSDSGIVATIVPDLSPETNQLYQHLYTKHNVTPIYIATPNSSPKRLKQINQHANGFIYGVARTGVTGSKTHTTQELEQTINRYREAFSLPLAIGFGIQSQDDIRYLTGKTDIAIIGSQFIKIWQKEGTDGIASFLQSLQLEHENPEKT